MQAQGFAQIAGLFERGAQFAAGAVEQGEELFAKRTPGVFFKVPVLGKSLFKRVLQFIFINGVRRLVVKKHGAPSVFGLVGEFYEMLH